MYSFTQKQLCQWNARKCSTKKDLNQNGSLSISWNLKQYQIFFAGITHQHMNIYQTKKQTEMKKVNKQSLLDTPRTVRFSEKTWQVIVQTSRPKFWKEDFSRICANKNYKLLHAYVQCVYIVFAKYQIAPSKAVVGVERPIKALSMHIQMSYKVIIV